MGWVKHWQTHVGMHALHSVPKEQCGSIPMLCACPHMAETNMCIMSMDCWPLHCTVATALAAYGMTHQRLQKGTSRLPAQCRQGQWRCQSFQTATLQGLLPKQRLPPLAHLHRQFKG